MSKKENIEAFKSGYDDCIVGLDVDGLMHYTTSKNINITDGTWRVVRVTLKDNEFIEGPMQGIADEKRQFVIRTMNFAILQI